MITVSLVHPPRLVAATVALLALTASACDKFESSSGAQLDGNGAVILHVGECGPPEVIQSLRILDEDDAELWAVHAGANASLSGPFTTGFHPGSRHAFVVETTIIRKPGDDPASYDDYMVTDRLERERVYLGSLDEYEAPANYQASFKRRVCP